MPPPPSDEGAAQAPSAAGDTALICLILPSLISGAAQRVAMDWIDAARLSYRRPPATRRYSRFGAFARPEISVTPPTGTRVVS